MGRNNTSISPSYPLPKQAVIFMSFSPPIVITSVNPARFLISNGQGFTS
jgi:hypothetical protein